MRSSTDRTVPSRIALRTWLNCSGIAWACITYTIGASISATVSPDTAAVCGQRRTISQLAADSPK